MWSGTHCTVTDYFNFSIFNFAGYNPIRAFVVTILMLSLLGFFLVVTPASLMSSGWQPSGYYSKGFSSCCVLVAGIWGGIAGVWGPPTAYFYLYNFNI